jgi:hypothetical protein
MASLQSRLNQVFGRLTSPTNDAPAWTPSQQNIFRAGAPVDSTAAFESDDDEALEDAVFARRETMPGVAMDLTEEDAPDATGLRPSAAFCRQVDDEDETDLHDTLATITGVEEARPSGNTEVLDDNVYEQRLSAGQSIFQPTSAHELTVSSGAVPMTATAAQATTTSLQDMDVEDAVTPWTSRSSLGRTSVGTSSSSRPSLTPQKSSLRKSRHPGNGVQKRVSFTGLPPPPPPVWVPPHRRPGYVPRITPARQQQELAGVMQAHTSPDKIPNHVQHPEKYTRYDLGQEITVGGGVAQLAAERDTNALDIDEAQHATASEMDDGAASAGDVCDAANAAVRPQYTRQGALTARALGSSEGAIEAHSTRPRVNLSWQEETGGRETKVVQQMTTASRRQYRTKPSDADYDMDS